MDEEAKSVYLGGTSILVEGQNKCKDCDAGVSLQ